MMDFYLTYFDNFMKYVNQIMLFTLNLYSSVCQLYLNKSGRKKFKVLYVIFSFLAQFF